jgi:hypothetical protein
MSNWLGQEPEEYLRDKIEKSTYPIINFFLEKTGGQWWWGSLTSEYQLELIKELEKVLLEELED